MVVNISPILQIQNLPLFPFRQANTYTTTGPYPMGPNWPEIRSGPVSFQCMIKTL